jgi:hypothetical protein
MHTKRHRLYLRKLRKLHRKSKRKGGGVYSSLFGSSKDKGDAGESKEMENETTNANPTIFSTENISLQPIPKDYKSVGILHITESSGINALRSMGTEVFNIFGSKGFDNGVYDYLRKTTFERVNETLNSGQKVFNTRLDFETNPQGSTIFLHLYGDLCEPIPKKNDNSNDGEDENV